MSISLSVLHFSCNCFLLFFSAFICALLFQLSLYFCLFPLVLRILCPLYMMYSIVIIYIVYDLPYSPSEKLIVSFPTPSLCEFLRHTFLLKTCCCEGLVCFPCLLKESFLSNLVISGEKKAVHHKQNLVSRVRRWLSQVR